MQWGWGPALCLGRARARARDAAATRRGASASGAGAALVAAVLVGAVVAGLPTPLAGASTPAGLRALPRAVATAASGATTATSVPPTVPLSSGDRVVAVATTADSGGTWVASARGGVYTSGDAPFSGSMGGTHLNQPIVGMASDPATGGYWLVAADGGVFSFTAPFYGSAAGSGAAVAAMAVEGTGEGYVLCDADGVCTVGGAGAPIAAARALVPPEEPAANVTPQPTFHVPQPVGAWGETPGPCWAVSGSPGAYTVSPDYARASCIAAELDATDHARALEGLAPASLPGDFSSLTAAEQLFVLTDIERVSRGEQPVLGLAGRLDADAQQGAAADADPGFSAMRTLPTALGGGANWGAAMSTLDADYSWLYLDGYDGPQTANVDCGAPGAPGCWAHRANILSTARVLVMGAAVAPGNWNGYNSYAEELIALRSASGAPPLYYTWADAVAAGAAG